MELLRELRHGERDGEEVERIPRPGDEADEKEQPLLKIEHRDELEGIRSLMHGRLQGGKAGSDISSR